MQTVAGLAVSEKYKIRLLNDKYGEISIETTIISGNEYQSNKLFISDIAVDEKNVLLYHKTTFRPWYIKAMEEIKNNNCFDMLFFNSKGEITEGAISNVFIEKNGILYTPEISSGLLPGILRKTMIREKQCMEIVLYKEDIFSADAIYCGNSVRGLVKVELH